MEGSLLIEFVGLPGSGKSTLARTVAGMLHDRGVTVREVNRPLMIEGRVRASLRRVMLALRFVMSRPRLGLRSAAGILGTSQRRLSDTRAVLTNWLCKCRLMDDLGRTRGIYVSDEGVLHAVWSIRYSAARPASRAGDLAATIRALLPDRWIVVFVASGDDVAKHRLLTRPGRPNRLARDMRGAENEAAQNATAALAEVRSTLDRVSRLACGADITVLTLENGREADLHPNSRYICDVIAGVT